MLNLLIALLPLVLFAGAMNHEFCHESLKVEVSKFKGSGPLVVNSSRGPLYFYPREGEGKKLHQVLSSWKPKDNLVGWSVSAENPKLLAIENQTNGSVVFAYLSAQAPKSLEKRKREVQLLGERCSGTNFLQTLVSKHLFVNFVRPYGSKHFPTWFSLTQEWKEDHSTIFLVIFRNPYDWLRSLHKKPHHTAYWEKQTSFQNFVSCEWVSYYGDGRVMLEDLNPVGNVPFKNALKMRSAKVQSFLALKEAPCHFFIRYEDLNETPFLYLLELAESFDLRINSLFTPVEIHVHSKKRIPKVQKYPPIEEAVKEFIDNELDWDLEREVGYTLEDYS